MKTVANRSERKRFPDWKICKVGAVAESTDYVANGSFASLKQNVTYRSDPDYAVLVRLTDFTKGWSGKYVYVDKSAYEFLRKSSLSVGDVVVANVGDPGRVFRVPDLGRPMTLGPNAVLIRPGPELDRGFLAYFLSSSEGQTLIAGITTGTAQKKFNKTGLRQLSVPVPELSEQREIVAEIEKQFTRLEAGVAGLRRVQANLKRYRAAVLKAACEGELVPTEAELARQEGRSYETGAQLLERILTERRQKWSGKGKYKEPAQPDAANLPKTPEGWTWTSLETLAGVVDPQPSHRTPPEVSGGVPYVGMGDVGVNRCIDLAHARKVAWSVLAEHRDRYRLQHGDFFVGKIGTIGKPVSLRAPFGYILSANVVLIQPHISGTASSFVFIYLDSPDSERAFLKGSRATTQAAFGIQKFRLLPIPLPPLAEQQRIVAEVERRLSVIQELEAVVNANLRRAARLRQAILQRAFSGALCQ